MIKWGILGAGNIAHRFAKSLSMHEECVLYAFSCRKEEKARAFFEEYPCEKYYTGENCYEDLLNDPEIDAIYLCLPHGLHSTWAIKALDKKKAVLCEKPAVIYASQMKKIKEAALRNNTLFVEGMKSRFLPAYKKAKAMIEEGAIGEIVKIEADQCRKMPEGHILGGYMIDPEQGGMTLDSGCYCLTWLEDYTKGDIEAKKVRANFYKDVDAYSRTLFEINGIACVMETGFDRNSPNAAVFHGTKAVMRITPVHRPNHICIEYADNTKEEYDLPYDHDDFYSEIDEVVSLLKQGKIQSDIMSLDDSIRQAELNDRIREHFRVKQEDIDTLLKQEEVLQYPSFNNRDALILGNKIVELNEHYDAPVSVGIYKEPEGTMVFLHLMDGKAQRNIDFMNGKREVLLNTGHSSVYAYMKHMQDGSFDSLFDHYPPYMPSAGAFPIRVDGKHVASVVVSGIHEGGDHDLIVEALSEILDKKVEDIVFAIQ